MWRLSLKAKSVANTTKIQDPRSKILFIVGQTASGKSGLAMKLAKEIEGELICADSLTVYKGLDIGTAKPTRADQAATAHHLLDVADGNKPFTVADFKELAEEAIEDIRSRGKTPIVVGGSGLYVNSLLYDYKFGPVVDQSTRGQLEAKDIEELQEIIINSGYKMPENRQNKRYLVRAIEQKGVNSANIKMRDDALVVGLRIERDKLETRIRERLELMLEQGLLEEVEWAYSNYPENSEALKGNIYQVLRPHYFGELELEAALENFIVSDLKLAKKQISWFKRNNDIHWFRDADGASSFVKKEL